MKKLVLSQSAYTWCKWLVIIVLPALASLIVGLSPIWGFDEVGDKISQTIMLVDTFLGAILCISNYNYYKKDDKS